MKSSESTEGYGGVAVETVGSSTRSNFRRLTSRKHSKSPSPPQVEKTDVSAPEISALEQHASTASSGSAKVPKLKLNALYRLKKIGTRKGKEKAVFSGFPPKEWFTAEAHETSIRDAQAGPSDAQTTDIPGAFVEDVETAEVVKVNERDVPEDLTVAQRVQQLLSILKSSLPTQIQGLYSPPAPSSPSHMEEQQSTATSVSTSTVSAAAPNASSTPPPPPTTEGLIQDKFLITLLSSTAVMNDSLARGKESISALLDRLKLPLSRSASTAEAADAKGKGKARAPDSDDASQGHASIEGSEDVMLYAPLEPRADSEVEVAESEILSMCGNSEDEDEEGTVTPKAPDFTESVGDETVKKDEKTEKKVKEKVIWVPSRTKISVQALWWGYRIYLPPPILMILNDKSVEAAKRAALITTALKWLLDHLPLEMLPPPLRPAAALLRSLVPLIGYIGSFIGWSWSAVCSFDRGQGVVLSATWLLPIALIPGTWEENELPEGAQIVSVSPAYPVPSAAGSST